jgi:hypothetical protein
MCAINLINSSGKNHYAIYSFNCYFYNDLIKLYKRITCLYFLLQGVTKFLSCSKFNMIVRGNFSHIAILRLDFCCC